MEKAVRYLRYLRGVIKSGRTLDDDEEKIYIVLLNNWRNQGGNYPYLHVDPM